MYDNNDIKKRQARFRIIHRHIVDIFLQPYCFFGTENINLQKKLNYGRFIIMVQWPQ